MIESALIAGAVVAIASPIVTNLVKSWLARSKNRTVRVKLKSGKSIDYNFDRKLEMKDIENLLRNDARLNEKAKEG